MVTENRTVPYACDDEGQILNQVIEDAIAIRVELCFCRPLAAGYLAVRPC